MSIDYTRANKMHRVMKSKLTRAINSKNPDKVRDACVAALAEWKLWGAWPDDWHRWNIALSDATGEDLEDIR